MKIRNKGGYLNKPNLVTSFRHALHMLAHLVFNCETLRTFPNSLSCSSIPSQILFIMFPLKIGLKYSLCSKTNSVSCTVSGSVQFRLDIFNRFLLLSYVVRIFSVIVFSSKIFLNTNSALKSVWVYINQWYK